MSTSPSFAKPCLFKQKNRLTIDRPICKPNGIYRLPCLLKENLHGSAWMMLPIKFKANLAPPSIWSPSKWRQQVHIDNAPSSAQRPASNRPCSLHTDAAAIDAGPALDMWSARLLFVSRSCESGPRRLTPYSPRSPRTPSWPAGAAAVYMIIERGQFAQI